MKQKNIFMKAEGNNFFERNKNNLPNHNIRFIENFILKKFKKRTYLLEIGCGEGKLLESLSKKKRFTLYGVDPSKKAINFLKKKNIGIQCSVGTADDLNFKESFFDIVVFGFCLYLVDKSLLFKIAFEADRVLKNNGFILIYDFFKKKSKTYEYIHHKKILTHKMNFSKMFLWSPNYKIFIKKIGDYNNIMKKIKNNNNSISIFLLKKCVT
jgi:ubiquinone/menaquinone biosynthesis C-methylase UbiE